MSTQEFVDADVSTLASPTPRTRTFIIGVALLAGLATASIVTALRIVGNVHGAQAAALLVLALVLAPTSREFSRRLLVNGLFAAGWVQSLWWVDLPLDRAGIALAIIAGTSACAVVLYSLRHGWRTVLPRFRATDAVPLFAAAAGTVLTRRWLLVKSPRDALANLLPGWDNSGHFDMFRMIWMHGRTIDSVPPPGPGDNWHYFDYPQGFHATAVAIAQLLWPNAIHDVGASLMAYDKVSVGLVVAATTLVVFGICALPSMRHHWYLAAPLGALVTATFLTGAGPDTMRAGFTAFVYPCAILAATVPVAIMLKRAASPTLVAALCGGMVLVAQSWALLLVLAVPIVGAALFPLERSYWSGTRTQWATTGLIVVASGAAALRALGTLSGGGKLPSLTTTGWIKPPPLGPTTVITASVLALTVIILGTSRGSHGTLRVRVTLLSLAVPVALMTSIALARAQVHDHGQIGYYTWKFVLAWLFIGSVLLVALLASIPLRTHAQAPFGAIVRIIGALSLSVAAFQWYGYVGPVDPPIAGASQELATTSERQFSATVQSMSEGSAELLAAAATISNDSPTDAVLLLPSAGPVNPQNAQQWYLSLSGTWTEESNFASLDLAAGQTDLQSTANVARAWLQKYRGRLVVDPQLRTYLLNGDLRDQSKAVRLVTWGR